MYPVFSIEVKLHSASWIPKVYSKCPILGVQRPVHVRGLMSGTSGPRGLKITEMILFKHNVTMIQCCGCFVWEVLDKLGASSPRFVSKHQLFCWRKGISHCGRYWVRNFDLSSATSDRTTTKDYTHYQWSWLYVIYVNQWWYVIYVQW